MADCLIVVHEWIPLGCMCPCDNDDNSGKIYGVVHYADVHVLYFTQLSMQYCLVSCEQYDFCVLL